MKMKKKYPIIFDEAVFAAENLGEYLPDGLTKKPLAQQDVPRIAKNSSIIREIESALAGIPTTHALFRHDSRSMKKIPDESVHLILTSPPYWNLKRYNEADGQLGHISSYEVFLDQLDKVWKECFRVLIPGGRLICVVGDVCLARRNNGGRHTVVPLHSSIQEHCRLMGYDNLAPIIWHKISNAKYEAGGGSAFLGKPYEPNAVIKNDIEYILMEKKPGYRSPDTATRLLSVISETNHKKWFNQIWEGVTGASTKDHPAPFPLELAERLIRMFSFVKDVVLDPFMGTGTTNIAAARNGRNSIGFEVDPSYFKYAYRRIDKETASLLNKVEVSVYEGE